MRRLLPWFVVFVLGGLGLATATVLAQGGTPTEPPPPTDAPPACAQTLQELWEIASDACLGGPIGYVCNGGSSPQAEPAGQVNNALANIGALVHLNEVQSLRTLPIITQVVGGGVAYVRLDTPPLTALLVGEVEIRNVAAEGFPAWQSLLVRTGGLRAECTAAPHNLLLLQSFGPTERMVVNGVSVDVFGTIAVRTIGNNTVFLALEGQNSVTALGTTQTLWVGQMVTVPYSGEELSRPSGQPTTAMPLDPALIANTPVGLLDRITALPQPGFVRTRGQVNLRAIPDANGDLLLQVPANEVLKVLGTDPTGLWLHVSLNSGFSGWMLAELLERNTGPVNVAYAATPIPPQRYGVLSTQATVRAPAGLYVRSAPDVSFPAVATLPDGALVTVVARSPYSPWVRIEVAGMEPGWVALLALETQANVNALPVDYSVPYPATVAATALPPSAFGNAFPDPRRRE